MKTTRQELAALRQMYKRPGAHTVSAAMIANLAAKGLCSARGNLTDEGARIGFSPASFVSTQRARNAPRLP